MPNCLMFFLRAAILLTLALGPVSRGFAQTFDHRFVLPENGDFELREILNGYEPGRIFSKPDDATSLTLSLERGVYILHAPGASVWRDGKQRGSALSDDDYLLHVGGITSDVRGRNPAYNFRFESSSMTYYRKQKDDTAKMPSNPGSGDWIFEGLAFTDGGVLDLDMLPGMRYMVSFTISCYAPGCLYEQYPPYYTPTVTPTITLTPGVLITPTHLAPRGQ